MVPGGHARHGRARRRGIPRDTGRDRVPAPASASVPACWPSAWRRARDHRAARPPRRTRRCGGRRSRAGPSASRPRHCFERAAKIGVEDARIVHRGRFDRGSVGDEPRDVCTGHGPDPVPCAPPANLSGASGRRNRLRPRSRPCLRSGKGGRGFGRGGDDDHRLVPPRCREDGAWQDRRTRRLMPGRSASRRPAAGRRGSPSSPNPRRSCRPRTGRCRWR